MEKNWSFIILIALVIILSVSLVGLLVLNKNLAIQLTVNDKNIQPVEEKVELTGNTFSLNLDANENFVNFALPETKYLDLEQGKYQLSLETTFNYALGYDFAYGNKVVISAVTNGSPAGHIWVLEKGKPLIINLFDSYSPAEPIRLWAFFPELGPTRDNTGSATVTIEKIK